MNFQDQNKPAQDTMLNTRIDAKIDPVDDATVEAALKHFRAQVHNWSEQEFAKPRTVRHSAWDAFWRTLARPAMAGSLTAAMLLASIGVPATMHYQHQAAAERQARQLAQIEQEQRKAAEEAALRKAADSIDDETLLSGIDSDIAQDTPDAMQPLASLMSDSGTSAKAAR
jgi:hypothetical protein